MAKIITQEEYKQRVYEINPNIELLSPFLGSTKDIKYRCKIDGYIGTTTARELYRQGCPRCSGKERKTPARFVEELAAVNPNIQLLSDYKNVSTRVKCKCKIDGYEWEAFPGHLLQGHGCHKCGGVVRKDTFDFTQEMSITHPDVEVLGEYKGNKSKILLYCKKCGNTWKATPNALIRGGKARTGCPYCQSSQGEREIARVLEQMQVPYIQGHRFNDCRNIHSLPFDFYLPAQNTAVEYDGEQHFFCVTFCRKDKDNAQEILEQQQRRDSIKTKYCEENNIRLIRIPYTEYENIENILKDLL